jgi:dTDP-4-amino-4,6-dideoxygalactose transaminase
MIRIIKPYLKYRNVNKKFKKIFKTGFFTKGEYVNQFQNDLCNYLKCKHVFLTTSATTALSLSLEIINIKPGDEVIVSDFSYPASANVIENIGAIPIFVDVDLETYNMCPKDLLSKITPKTKAVMFVDALGNPSNIHSIKTICEKNNITLIEDAACALGSSEFGVKNGNIADLTCFSFHPRKLLTTGEGGAITTNNKKYSDLLKVKLNHGAIYKNNKFDFIQPGYNYRMTEFQSVMGIESLTKLDKVIQSRIKIKEKYIKLLSPLGFTPQKLQNEAYHNIQSVIFKVPELIKRDDLILFLKKHNIESTLGTYCLSNTTYYKAKYNKVQPNALYLEQNTITLPCYKGVNVKKIVKKIEKFILNNI